jgi:hypothetical protein
MKALSQIHSNIPTLSKLCDSLERLSHHAQPRWGSMNASEMLSHNLNFIDLYLGHIPQPFFIRCMARLLGPYFIRRLINTSPESTPKNLMTLKELRTPVSASDDVHFNQLKTKLIQQLIYLDKMDEQQLTLDQPEPVIIDHVLYGKMLIKDLKTIIAHHLSHHLHQFNALNGIPDIN